MLSNKIFIQLKKSRLPSLTVLENKGLPREIIVKNRIITRL